MRDVRFKPIAAIGYGTWTHGTVAELLLRIPYLLRRLPPLSADDIPPLAKLNRVLATGRCDAGMSGGCEWRPIQLTESEYEEIVEELLTNPEFHQ